MKRSYLFAVVFAVLIGGLTIKSPAAHAFDTNALSTYFQANNVVLDQSGNIQIDWQKIQLGFGGYGIDNRRVGVSINGTSSVPAPFFGVGGFQGFESTPVSQYAPGFGCSSYDTFGGASQSVSGNHFLQSEIWDASSSAYTSSTNISFSTPIYISLWTVSFIGGTCGRTTDTFLDSQTVFLNAINEPVSAFFLQPFQDETINDFPAWSVAVSNNSDVEQTGTLYINYGISSSTFSFSDSSTYDLPPGTDQQFTINKSQKLTYPQQTTSTVIYSQLELINTSTALDLSQNQISFFVNPNAPSYQVNPIGFPGFNQSTTNQYGVSCGYTSSTFFSDPAANIQIGFCNVIVYLFLPTTDQQNDLSNRFTLMGSSVSKKPPFGYFAAISTDLNQFTINSSTATTTLLDATGTAALAPVFQPLDEGLGSIILLLLGLWIFNRARLFEPS